jgi:hypothetical protein
MRSICTVKNTDAYPSDHVDAADHRVMLHGGGVLLVDRKRRRSSGCKRLF